MQNKYAYHHKKLNLNPPVLQSSAPIFGFFMIGAVSLSDVKLESLFFLVSKPLIRSGLCSSSFEINSLYRPALSEHKKQCKILQLANTRNCRVAVRYTDQVLHCAKELNLTRQQNMYSQTRKSTNKPQEN